MTSNLDQLTFNDKGKVYILLYVPYLVIVGAEAVMILSNRVRQINVQTRFMVDSNAWPPEQPTSFTPPLLIHHQGGHCTPDQVKAMAELTCTGNIDALVTPIQQDTYKYEESQRALDMSRATKEIEEILDPLEKSKEASFILIEGAPGIGK